MLSFPPSDMPDIRETVNLKLSQADLNALLVASENVTAFLSAAVLAQNAKSGEGKAVKMKANTSYGCGSCHKRSKAYRVATDLGKGVSREGTARKHEITPAQVSRYAYVCDVSHGSLLAEHGL